MGVAGILPSGRGRFIKDYPYMLALLDMPAALVARRGVPGLSAELPFSVVAGFTNEANGDYLLTVEGDELRCAPTPVAGGPVFHAGGLAALYGGSQRCASLRATGHLHGPVEHDPVWDALFNTPTQIRDYF